MRTICVIMRLSALMLTALTGLASGQLDTVWFRRWDGGMSNEDWVSDMTVDATGNIYLAGSAITTSSGTDIVVQKYSPTGTRLWSAVYNGSANLDDSAAALVVDDSGNAYVCGSSNETGRGEEMVTIKFSSGGAQRWARTFGRKAGNYSDAALAICLDRASRVVVTGYSTDTSGYNVDYCTISYKQSNGDTNWVRFYNKTPEYDEDVAVGVCCDAQNNVYVTGYSYDEDTDYDIVTIKYTPTGSRPWWRRFNNPYNDLDDYGVCIAYNPANQSVVVGGYVYDEVHDYDYFTIAYGTGGDSLWSRTYNNYPTNGEDVLQAITVDGAGNVYVTGMTEDAVGGYDVATVSYDRYGIPRWDAKYDYDGLDEIGCDLVADSLGQLFVIGTAETVYDMDMLLLKYDTDGVLFWDYLYNNAQANDEDWGARVAVQPDGRIIVSGSSFSASTDMDFVLFKALEVTLDMAVLAVIAPESLRVGDSLAPLAVVQNLSTVRESCWVWFRPDWTDYLDSAWVNLGVGEVDTVSFSVWRPETTGVAKLLAWSMMPGEMHPENDSAWALVTVWEETTGVVLRPAVELRPSVELWPNPARGAVLVRLSLPRGEPGRVRLYDPCGTRVLAEQEVMTSDRDGTASTRFDLDRLAAGVYFVKLEVGDKHACRKLVLQR
ncbi:MAG: T9SS type A sorting domain-containing protein [candidate division WOR-3 bacterium]